MVQDLLRGLEQKPVFDYNHMPLGTIRGTSLDPETHDPTALIIDLHTQVRDRLKAGDETVTVPFDMVFGIRRHEVTLSRSLPELVGIYARRESGTETRLERSVSP